MAIDLEGLLGSTSRTFALTIPLLPEPTRRAVTIAYLLFRVADTLEDADLWPRARKVEELGAFASLLDERGPSAVQAFVARVTRTPPVQHAGYQALLAQTEELLQALDACAPRARRTIITAVRVTCEGMSTSVRALDAAREARSIVFTQLEQLRRYCYFVAGVVGEMLTELFILDAPGLAVARDDLLADAAAFGEGLQLTNILKDAEEDARVGRHFIPASIGSGPLFALARGDLDAAVRYVARLDAAQAPAGFLAFTALPVRLALETLALVERQGPGAKISRQAVAEAAAEIAAALAPGKPGALEGSLRRASQACG